MNFNPTKDNPPVVLIVEDDIFMRMQLVAVMEQEGYQIVEASNGEEALAAYICSEPDIVLLDALMPVMDGFSCCKQLQKLLKGANTPILMITSLEDQASVDLAFEVGASDFIPKPIHWAVLRHRVRRLLQASRTTEQLQQNFLRERLLTGITQHIRRSLDIQEILNTTVTEVQQFLVCDRVLCYRFFANGSGEVVSEEVVPGYPSLLGKHFSDPGLSEAYHHLFYQGWFDAIADIEKADLKPEEIQFLQKLGVKARLVIPIFNGEALWGALVAHHYSIRNWSIEDIELLQKLAEQLNIALAQAELLETVQEREERFRQLAENIDQFFWISDPDKNEMIYISPGYEKIWERSCISLYQQPKSFLDVIHSEDRERVIAALPKQIVGDYDEEYRIIKPDGSIRWISDRAFPIQNSTGEVHRIVGIAADITKQKQAEADIYQALTYEKELNELKSRFISIASHEFRTPLTTILAAAEFLEYYQDKLTEDKRIKYLYRIKNGVKYMTDLLNDVLTLAKAEAGKVEVNPTSLDLVDFCDEYVQEMQLSLGGEHSLLFMSCPDDSGNIPGSFWVKIDEKLLRHILSNLLSNAIKYSPAKTRVWLKLICEDDFVIFQVQDEGIGIPSADLQRLFESFHRGQNVGTTPGTGLGLAIVKKSVDLLDGDIVVTSEIGVGTTFTVKLPASQLSDYSY